MSDTTSIPDDGAGDQDAEPSLNAPGEAGPTGIDVDDAGTAAGGGNRDADDQDAEPTRQSPAE